MPVPVRRGERRRRAQAAAAFARPGAVRGPGRRRIQAVAQRGSGDRPPAEARKVCGLADPTVCELCGAMFHLKRWRQPHALQPDLLSIAEWDECPACRQEGRGPAGGVVALRGDWEAARREEILRRIENVAARAEHTQPQHRVLEIREADGGIEVCTTSQKVAHRIAHELEKAFGGHARYSWSDRDGRLLATWNA